MMFRIFWDRLITIGVLLSFTALKAQASIREMDLKGMAREMMKK